MDIQTASGSTGALRGDVSREATRNALISQISDAEGVSRGERRSMLPTGGAVIAQGAGAASNSSPRCCAIARPRGGARPAAGYRPDLGGASGPIWYRSTRSGLYGVRQEAQRVRRGPREHRRHREDVSGRRRKGSAGRSRDFRTRAPRTLAPRRSGGWPEGGGPRGLLATAVSRRVSGHEGAVRPGPIATWDLGDGWPS
jgi:hypothetical protein